MSKSYRSGCCICGGDLVYFQPAKTLSCSLCGARHETNAACADAHFVCDKCHAQRGMDFIAASALGTKSKNPFEIADGMMRDERINMHGPEHHFLVPAALLAAYRNAGGAIDLAACLDAARQRAKQVPGGVCGLWGSCGAGIGTGIFISLVTASTPIAERAWSLSNQMTARALGSIAEHGGPRCCKRDSYLAMHSAAAFVGEHLGVVLEVPQSVSCVFFHRNKQCRREECLFFPREKGSA